MSTTANLGLTNLDPAQAQKEVTINGNWSILDSLVTRKTGDTMTGGLKLQRSTLTSGTPNADLWHVEPADTGLANAESVSILFDGSAATRQFTGGGSIFQQRYCVLNAPTYSAASAQTLSQCATLHIFGAPIAGTNVTIQNAAALWVQGGASFGNLVRTANTALVSLQAGQNSGQTRMLYVNPIASSGLPASTEIPTVDFDMNRTATWSGGNISTQREVVVRAPTYAFASASTITSAASFAVSGAPVAGSNATLTNAWAIWAQSGPVGIEGSAIATANYGTLSVGSGGFVGGGGNNFAGNSNGTLIAVNSASGFAGTLVDVQKAGARQFVVHNNGNVYALSNVMVGLVSTSTTPAGMITTQSGTTADTIYTQAAFTFNNALSNRGINIQHILDASTSNQYIWMNGTLGSSSTRATPTATSTFAKAFGLECLDSYIAIVQAPVGTNQTINRVLGVDQNSRVFCGNSTTTAGAQFQIQRAGASNPTNPVLFKVVGNADTSLPTTTEVADVSFELNRTQSWVAGNISTQRAIRIFAPTWAADGATTITDGATLAINAAPTAGANVTITNNYALWVQGGGARISGHIRFGGSAPTAAAGSNAGSSPPAPVVTSGASDTRGNITFGTGTGPAAGNMVAVTFNASFVNAPYVQVTPKNSATASLNLYVTSVTTSGFTLACVNTPSASQGNTTYSFDFLVIE